MPITKTDLQKYKKRLEEMKTQISQALTNCTAEVKKPDEATGYSQHQADQGTDDFDRRISLEVTSQEFQVLRLIERALEKITEGSYGVCDISGEEIPKARLEAMPYASTTVKAQEKLERGMY
ncbi:MAG: TraR/DksA family transcriptional regulator [Chlamydiales bacterium]|nr:TraR/DksA family transcriptional regulator [Chlamydiales bacterium]